jgi:predicted alpha-1,6-mannanase (GH76 family)
VSERDGGAAAPAAPPAGDRSARRWAARAELAERAVRVRHLRRVWGLPGTLLGVCAAPPTPAQRAFQPWNYWWQAHVLDCLVDAYIRAPEPQRRARVARFADGIRLRNGRGWLNDYYDDMAWLALALQRAERSVGVRRRGAVGALAQALRSGWTDESGGGIWWRLKDKYGEDFKNTPTNGPAAILFARVRDPRGYDTARWIERHLVDPQTGVVWDGVHLSADGGIREIETARYTYCQGVYLGACVELAAWGQDGGPGVWGGRAVRTIEAVAEHLTSTVPADGAARYAIETTAAPGRGGISAEGTTPPGGVGVSERGARVLAGRGGADGGLFAGILARYLAQAALVLPEFGPGFAAAAGLAADLVFDSAHAAWANQAVGPEGPVFGPEWSRPAVRPHGHGAPEADLSVQTGAWMLVEAAALLARSL